MWSSALTYAGGTLRKKANPKAVNNAVECLHGVCASLCRLVSVTAGSKTVPIGKPLNDQLQQLNRTTDQMQQILAQQRLTMEVM